MNNEYNEIQRFLLTNINETIDILKYINDISNNNYLEFYLMEDIDLVLNEFSPMEIIKLTSHKYFDINDSYFSFYEYVLGGDKIVSLNLIDIIEYIENNIYFIEKDLIENITEIFISEELQNIIDNM